MCVWGGWLEGGEEGPPGPGPGRHPRSAPERAGAAPPGFWPTCPPPRGEGLRPLGVARGPEAPPRGWPSRKRGARRAGARARCGARGGGVCAGLGGQPRRTAAAGARGAGRKSLFTQTAHRLGNNAVKEVSRLGLTAPTSCSHTHQRGGRKKKRGARERKKKGGKSGSHYKSNRPSADACQHGKSGAFARFLLEIPPKKDLESSSTTG